jgi:hypothetical protein
MVHKRPIVFIVNGFPLSGKDTFAEALALEYQVANISSVDEVKDIATIMGWDGTKTPENRKMLSDLKDFATKYFDLPFKDMVTKIGDNLHKDFIVLHIREAQEIDRMKEYLDSNGFPVYSVLVDRKSVLPETASNHADENIYDAAYDIILYNNGTVKEYIADVLEFGQIVLTNPIGLKRRLRDDIEKDKS